MPDYKSIAKGGWHPSWDKSINKDNIKNPRAWLGKGGNDPAEAVRDHQSTPLASLRDPASFGPPPKHSAYHGEAALASPTNTTGSSSYSPATRNAPPLPGARPDSRQQQITRRVTDEEVTKPASPPVPYRTDTTGLSTANLPKPPVRRTNGSVTPQPAPAAKKPPPSLPPRLPPRQTEYPDEHTGPPPPAYTETTNHGFAAPNSNAISRLTQSGVSVPGLNIGRNESPSRQPAAAATSPSSAGHPSQMSELQARFARMNNTGNNASPPASPTASVAKKGPPPPPPKKKELGSSAPLDATPGHSSAPPPPIPMSSKPRPG